MKVPSGRAIVGEVYNAPCLAGGTLWVDVLGR